MYYNNHHQSDAHVLSMYLTRRSCSRAQPQAKLMARHRWNSTNQIAAIMTTKHCLIDGQPKELCSLAAIRVA